MQLISGVSLPAYWASNLLADISKTYLPIFVILILQVLFDLSYDGVWELFILYPIAIVPFTYITAFIFTSDTVAQIVTIFVHFMVGGILPIVIFVLQNIGSTAALGDSMRWWFTFIPTFCVGQGIMFSSTYEATSMVRLAYLYARNDNGTLKYPDLKPINTNVYAMENLGGNYTIMICSAIFYCLLLVFIEADIFQSCSKYTYKKVPEPVQDLDLDDDVVAE